MPNLSLVDLSTRTKPMAEKKKKWVQRAIPESHKGLFKAKAERAGKTTKEFASEHAGDSGTLGKEARLAQTLMGMHKKRRSPLYDNPRSKSKD